MRLSGFQPSQEKRSSRFRGGFCLKRIDGDRRRCLRPSSGFCLCKLVHTYAYTYTDIISKLIYLFLSFKEKISDWVDVL